MDKKTLRQEITKLRIKQKEIKRYKEIMCIVFAITIIGIIFTPIIIIMFESEEKRLNRLIRELELELNQ